jgi:spermidine synthase
MAATPAHAWPTGPVTIDTGYAEVRPVKGDPAAAVLYINDIPSSPVDPHHPTRLDFEYLQWMCAAVETHLTYGEPLRAVHIGGAACALPRALDCLYPNARQLVIEVDAALTRFAREWFALPRAPRLRLRPGDGAVELASRPPGSANVIVRDAFTGTFTPAHLTGPAFLADAARVLGRDGIYLANCADDSRLNLAKGELAAAAQVFDHVTIMAEPSQFRGRRYGNAVIMAGWAKAALTAEGLVRRLRSLPAPARMISGLEAVRWAGRTRPPQD